MTIDEEKEFLDSFYFYRRYSNTDDFTVPIGKLPKIRMTLPKISFEQNFELPLI